MGLSLSSVSKIEWCVNIISSAGPFYVKNDIYIITLCIFLRNSLHKTPSKSWKISSKCRNNRIRNIHLCTLGALAWKREGLHYRVNRSLVLGVCFLYRCLSFFFWPLCCLCSIYRFSLSLRYLQTSNSIPTFNQCQESLRSKFRRIRHLQLML